jgi:GTPase SAR1 family protein
MPEAVIGKDAVTGDLITIGDLERRSGLYILGITGTGKTSLMINLMNHDFRQGHGVFFLDAHGDAIEDLLTRCGVDLSKPLLLDPEDVTHTFGINVLACKNLHDITERNDTSTRAVNVFKKLWEDEW